LVKQFGFFDPLFLKKPWLYGDNSTILDLSGGDDDDFDEDWEEAGITCPAPTSSSSSSSTNTATPTTTKDPAPPTKSPREGNPMTNKVKCYNGLEQKTERVQIVNAIIFLQPNRTLRDRPSSELLQKADVYSAARFCYRCRDIHVHSSQGQTSVDVAFSRVQEVPARPCG
jgi:hypothetical protein